MEESAVRLAHEFHASLPGNAVRIYRPDPSMDAYCVFSPWAEILERALDLSLRHDADDACIFVEFTEEVLKERVCDALPENSVVEVYTEKKLVKRGIAIDKGLFHDLTFHADTSTVSLRMRCSHFLSEQTVHVFCAYANLSLRAVGASSFYDQKSCFQNLKSFLCVTQVKDIVVETDGPHDVRPSRKLPTNSAIYRLLSTDEVHRLEEIMARHNVQITGKAASNTSWQPTYAVQLIEKVCLSQSVSPQWLTDCPDEVAVLGGLIDHLELISEECNHSQYRMRPVSLGSCLTMDENAMEALHLFGNSAESHKKSVFGHIEGYCSTKMGSRLLRFYLSQPLRDLEAIQYRQDMVTAFLEEDMLREAISRQVLSKVPDVDMLLKRFQRQQATIKDVCALRDFATSMLALGTILKDHEGGHEEELRCELFFPLLDMCGHFERLTGLISETIEEGDPYGHIYRVKPQFDEVLEALDRQRSALSKEIESEYESVVAKQEWNDKQVKLETLSQGTFAFRITRKSDRLIAESPEFEVVQKLKDSIRFVTAKMRSLNRNYKDVTSEYEDRQKALVDKLLEVVWTYRPVLDDANDFVSKLDVFICLATMVVRSRQKFCRPTFDGSTLKLDGVRHFLLGQTMEVVENSISFKHFDDSSEDQNSEDSDAGEVFIITGPNMGGKSTLMRSVGLTIILAQMGSYVPCRKAQIPLRDSILTRVGANDSILHGLSTFMVEMQEASHMISNATKDSFLIIDELGRGTSTYDGFGIACAIAEHIATGLHSFTMISTHFHEMTHLTETLSKDIARVRNVHMTADCGENDIHFPYRLLPGPILKSFGLHVAKVSRFPATVLQYAEEKIQSLEHSIVDKHHRDAADGDEHSLTTAMDCPTVLLASYVQNLSAGEGKAQVMEALRADSIKYLMLKEILRQVQ
ncbi:DNA mismatch repair protein MSH2 [Perkinsela sp. CCAP 1560/4]|nr:DNA mismatch repair protein MSH2 [Perkinsela sp. CCAP 1560/4]|eukprot:KNH04434.1 DNA mismatch repair protein MSH2 [Perkinsela sp. CCAP 1560/4]